MEAKRMRSRRKSKIKLKSRNKIRMKSRIKIRTKSHEPLGVFFRIMTICPR